MNINVRYDISTKTLKLLDILEGDVFQGRESCSMQWASLLFGYLLDSLVDSPPVKLGSKQSLKALQDVTLHISESHSMSIKSLSSTSRSPLAWADRKAHSSAAGATSLCLTTDLQSRNITVLRIEFQHLLSTSQRVTAGAQSHSQAHLALCEHTEKLIARQQERLIYVLLQICSLEA